MVDLVQLLRQNSLIEDRPAQFSVVRDDGAYNRDNTVGYPLDQLMVRLSEAGRSNPHTITVTGLRTSDKFPNLFREYTAHEEALSAWLTLKLVCGNIRASKGFEMDFSEVDFLNDDPQLSIRLLRNKLETLVGGPLDAECYSAEGAEEMP
jgi:hypothetical protein